MLRPKLYPRSDGPVTIEAKARRRLRGRRETRSPHGGGSGARRSKLRQLPPINKGSESCRATAVETNKGWPTGNRRGKGHRQRAEWCYSVSSTGPCPVRAVAEAPTDSGCQLTDTSAP